MRLTEHLALVGSGSSGFGLADGQRHVDTANRLFDAGFVPPSLV